MKKKLIRILYGALMLSLGLSLSGCGSSAQEPDAEPAGTALDMAAAIIDSQKEFPLLEPLDWESDDFQAYLTNYYGLNEGILSDGVICYAGGVEASEIAVLALTDARNVGPAEDAFLEYIDARADDFTGYVPDQAAMVERGVVAVNGRFVALLICPDPEAARTAFLACFEAGWTPPDTQVFFPEPVADPGIELPDVSSEPTATPEPTQDMEPAQPEPPETTPPAPIPEGTPDPIPTPTPTPEPVEPAPVPTPVPDHYDAAAVLSVWQGGDPTALTEKNRAVYDAAVQVIGEIVTDGMTDYEKELAVHDWMTAWGLYDPEANSHAPDASPDPDNDNPYGFLIHQVGICRGYASTFQLFMDMLGIECITVPGFSGGDEHAWNMVRLDGEWYCVDVTWDDPTGGSPGHRYFNVTSQYLRETNHQWDEASVPEATATNYAWSDG